VAPGIGNRFVKHTRKAKKVHLGLMKVMKRRTGKDETTLKKARDKLVKITREVITDGRAVHTELELLQEKPSLVNGLTGQLGEWIEAAEKVVGQTQEVIKENRHLPRRLVSLFDVDARPTRRGRLPTDTEFRRKVLLGETDHGIISTYQVLQDNPSDTARLKPGVKGHKRLFRKRLKAVAGDRGFYSQANEDWLKDRGVKQASIPKRGKISKERRRYQKQS
jgi:IS5 family transposase